MSNDKHELVIDFRACSKTKYTKCMSFWFDRYTFYSNSLSYHQMAKVV